MVSVTYSSVIFLKHFKIIYTILNSKAIQKEVAGRGLLIPALHNIHYFAFINWGNVCTDG